MINRRDFLEISASAGAALALTPELLRAIHQPAGTLIQRAIPSSGELLPVIGVARGSVQNNARLQHLADMANTSSDAYAMLKAVIKTMADTGGKVLDSAWGGAESQRVTSAIANDLGITNKVFWSTGLASVVISGSPPPEAAAVKADIDAVFERMKVPKIDLIMVAASSPDTVRALPNRLAGLREAKKEGRVRYIGVSSLPTPREKYSELETVMRNEALDFIGVPHYHISQRWAEETLLPLALERKIGVVVYMPFSLGRLFQRVSSRALPEWAEEFDAKTWAQFFLKYLVSHPAVTTVLPGTSSASHMLDNLRGGIGRLPNEATRARMSALMDSFPS